MVLGYFGKTPKQPDKEVIKIASEQLGLEPTTQSPRLLNDKDPKKGIAPATEKLKQAGLPVTDENIFIAATCADKGIAFLKGEAKVAVRYKQPASPKAPVAGVQHIVVDGTGFDVEIKGSDAIVNGKIYHVQQMAAQGTDKTQATHKASVSEPSQSNTASAGAVVSAPMLGTVTKINVKAGDHVQRGQDLMVLEVMKMENPIKAPTDGVVQDILVSQGTQVSAGQALVKLA